MGSSGEGNAHSTAGLSWALLGEEGWQANGEGVHVPGGGHSVSPGAVPCYAHQEQRERTVEGTRLDGRAEKRQGGLLGGHGSRPGD